MRQYIKYGITICITLLLIAASIFAPSVMAGLMDENRIDTIYSEGLRIGEAGYKYQLTAEERVFMFSRARENLSQSLRFTSNSLAAEFARLQNLNSSYIADDSSYAIFLNQKGSGNGEYSESEILALYKEEIKNLNFVPFFNDFQDDMYKAELYSIVNMADPSINLSIWEIAGNDIRVNSTWQFDIDAQTGKIYNFNIIPVEEIIWEDLDIDKIISDFCVYLEIPQPENIAETNVYEKSPSLNQSTIVSSDSDKTSQYQTITESKVNERTPYFKKYTVTISDNEQIPITVGLHLANNEFFIRMP